MDAIAVAAIGYEDFSSIFAALSSQISVSTIVALLGTLVGSVIGIVFMWWGVRKIASVVMSAFRKGKLSI